MAFTRVCPPSNSSSSIVPHDVPSLQTKPRLRLVVLRVPQLPGPVEGGDPGNSGLLLVSSRLLILCQPPAVVFFLTCFLFFSLLPTHEIDENAISEDSFEMVIGTFYEMYMVPYYTERTSKIYLWVPERPAPSPSLPVGQSGLKPGKASTLLIIPPAGFPHLSSRTSLKNCCCAWSSTTPWTPCSNSTPSR